MPETILELDNVGFYYQRRGEAVPVLGGLNLAVPRGEFVAIIGPSGCGKSTLFNLVTGLLAPAEGAIRRAKDTQVAYMPQRDLLLPWRTVLGNAILGPDLQGKRLDEVRSKAEGLLPLFGLEGFADAYPQELSGGMRQRVALLRTVLLEREIMLLDEPFGALDALTRAEMQEWLTTVCQSLNRTVVFTTHDIEEAAYLADRVYVLSPRPARVTLELQIPFPKPRRRSLVAEPDFNSLKAVLWRGLHPADH